MLIMPGLFWIRMKYLEKMKRKILVFCGSYLMFLISRYKDKGD